MVETQDRDAKLVTAVAAGTPPDVSVYDRYTIAGASARGIMRDLQPLARVAGVKGEDQQPWCWEEVFREGKLWGLPYSTDTRMVYVNAAHLKQAGDPAHRAQDAGRVRPGSCAGSPSGGRGASSASASSPGAVEQLAPLRLGLAARRRLVRRQGQPGHHGPPQEHRRAGAGSWPGRTSWAATRASRRSAARSPRTALMDMLKAGTLSAIINSTSQLIGMFAEKDLDWIVWAPPAGAGVDRTHTWSGGLRQRAPHRRQEPRGLVRPGQVPLGRGVPEGAEQDRRRAPAHAQVGGEGPPLEHRRPAGQAVPGAAAVLAHPARRSCRSPSSTASWTAPEGAETVVLKGQTPPAPRWQHGQPARQRRHQGRPGD